MAEKLFLKARKKCKSKIAQKAKKPALHKEWEIAVIDLASKSDDKDAKVSVLQTLDTEVNIWEEGSLLQDPQNSSKPNKKICQRGGNGSRIPK